MARTDPQINVRIEPELLQEVRASAKLNGRSLSAEVNFRLEASFDLEERVALQNSMISLHEEASGKSVDMVELLAEKILKAITTLAVNEDGTLPPIRATLEKVKQKRAKASGT